jgi:hypothetical protein
MSQKTFFSIWRQFAPSKPFAFAAFVRDVLTLLDKDISAAFTPAV